MTFAQPLDTAFTDTPNCVLHCADVIGESPIWCADSATLVWADIESDRLHRFHPASGQHSVYSVDIGITALVPTDADGWIAASRSGLYRLDADFKTTAFLLDPTANEADVRLNDAVADRAGRLWTGSLCEADLERPAGALYRLDAQLHCDKVDRGFAVANGIAASPNGKRLYAVDMFHRQIRCYDLNPVSGALGPAQIFASFTEADGKPDGLCCDDQGGLWVCHWGGGCVSRFEPDGRLSARIHLPVSQVTRCTFGGPDLRDLFICTAQFELSAAALEREPEAGGLFHIRVPWSGLPEALCNVGDAAGARRG
ncbi:SMP-30/gluconolactonase/LRE family protein [Saccharospirillum mangrovi]|uniref:SMP-30/gluconolactonase/LRE family protein n=1 Tax=Saccharospirillum mangrovi TaxID=2161747 RepID=UPI000D375498|nr:SMP-30/gluconolactonase/LRE family protein [Saccharospirillum mangrovi]